MMAPKKEVVFLSQKWALHKAADDATIAFPYERIKVENYICEQIDANVFVLLVFGVIPPTPGTLEKPTAILCAGFSQRFIPAAMVGLNDIRRMHVYKCDMMGTAQEFARAFFDNSENSTEEAEITGFPSSFSGKQKAEEQK